jgi:hypothetical protein
MAAPVFYVSVPQGDRTGGPECMHQLADAVIRRGYRTVMVPMWNFRGRTPDPEYDVYQYEVAEQIEDPDNAVLVVGEVSPIESFRELRQVPKERTWLWWLSVHNNPDPRARYYRGSPSCCVTTDPEGRGPLDSPRDGVLARRPVHRTSFADSTVLGLGREAMTRTTADYSPGRNPRTFATEYVSLLYNRRFIESGVGFLAQSVYAQGFCRSLLGRDALPMTDYLRRPDVPGRDVRPNVVLYNGAKGYSMIRLLAPLLPDIDFQPIEGMSYLQVCEALQSAAAYVELGVPPGRDRLPREAAHFGTPSVLLCRGSAYCWDDFPMPDRYRIPFVDNWPELMAPVVREVVADRNRALADQRPFREWVAGDRGRYEAEVDHWIEEALKAF